MGHNNTPHQTNMATPLENFVVSDPSRMLNDVERIQRVSGRVSALMEKGILPDGTGWNFQSVLSKRSIASGGAGWRTLTAPDGTGNNCVPSPSIVDPATQIFNYQLRDKMIRSNDICLTDYRRGYMFQQQVMNQRDNLVQEIVDQWDDSDKQAFIDTALHKIVYDTALTESSTQLPGVAATSQLTQSLLDSLYVSYMQDGGSHEAYADANGQPLISLITSMEGSRGIIKGDASVREDFRFAEMGKGDGATLMKSWGVQKAYGGYLHLIDNRMPRYNFVGGEYVRVPFYVNQATTNGVEAIVNPAYKTAEFEAAFLWHPKVVRREVPPPRTTVGADTSFKSVQLNGEIMWRNIPDAVENPMENIGFWLAYLQAAYRPVKPQYGYVVIWKRCPVVEQNPCPEYS